MGVIKVLTVSQNLQADKTKIIQYILCMSVSSWKRSWQWVHCSGGTRLKGAGEPASGEMMEKWSTGISSAVTLIERIQGVSTVYVIALEFISLYDYFTPY